MSRLEVTRAWSSTLVCSAVCLLLAACIADSGGQGADEGEHEHGGEAVTLWTESVELFYEYPAMIAGEPGEPWAIHLTYLDGFEPVVEGRLTLRLSGPGGEAHEFVAEAPVRPGIFTPAPSVPAPGRYGVVMELASERLSETIQVPPVEVYATLEAVPHAPEENGEISFLKEQQWVIEFATAPATIDRIERSVSAAGAISAVPSLRAEVAAPASGLVAAELNRGAPVLGTWVNRGRTLAVLAPVEGEGSYTGLLSRVSRLERELARAERLYAEEAVPRKRVEETRYELEAARAALESTGASTDGGYHYALTSPIAGVVNSRHLNLGSRVEAGDLLFTIVDPRSVWVRLSVPARHAPALGDVSGAVFTVEGSDRVYRADRLVAVSDIIDPDTRTIPVALEVGNPDRSLKIGMLADARVFVGSAQEGVAIPVSALLDEDGVPVAYVQTGGESFQRRVLVLGSSDGERVLVERGIEAGERVVSTGAYQVRLASLNTSEIADHGHPH